MSYIKVSMGFNKETDHGLETIANEVLTAMTDNASYPTPPVTLVELKAAVDAFSAAMAVQWSGGPPATSDKNDKRNELTELLIKLGSYVQIAANNDLTVLLSSGFKAVDTSHTSSPLAAPTTVKITNGGEGELVVKVKPVKHARSYEVRHAPADVQPEPWEAAVFTKSRDMHIANLLSGKRYVLQVRAIGGSTGQSNWSDPLSHVSL
jgi:hypothetical protein